MNYWSKDMDALLDENGKTVASPADIIAYRGARPFIREAYRNTIHINPLTEPS